MKNRIFTNSKFITFLTCFLFSLWIVPNAVGQEGFENVCDHGPFGQFNENCFPDWIPVSGTPSTSASGIAPFEGLQYASLRNYRKDCNGSTAFNQGGSSIAFSYNFIQGEEYTISYALSTNDNQVDARWVLSNGLLPKVGFDFGTCADVGDWIPDEAPTDQVLITENGNTMEDQWIQKTLTFIANSNFSQLWLKPINDNPLSNPFSGPGMLRLDAFEILCGNETKAPDFIFTDSQGNQKDEFCYGEDIYIRLLDLAFDWNSIRFSVWEQKDIGWYGNTGWIHDKMAIYNVSEYMRNAGAAPFRPDQSNYLRIAIDHWECDWQTRGKHFDYVCCEDQISADFISIKEEENGNLKYSVNAEKDFRPYGGSHEICIYTDLDEDGVFEQVVCSNNPFFTTFLDLDVFYYVTHRITTACGNFCSSEVFCRGNCVGDPSDFGCQTISDPNCKPPTMGCAEDVDGGVSISWSDVDAKYYWVEITSNDPDCGCDGERSSRAFLYKELSYDIAGAEDACFSFRVRSICDSGAISPWSPKRCMDDCDVVDDHEGPIKGRKQNILGTDDTKINAYPSPFNNRLNVELKGLNNDKVELRIVDFMGRLVKSETLTTMENNITYVWQSNESLTNGIYLIQVIDGNKVYTQKVIRN